MEEAKLVYNNGERALVHRNVSPDIETETCGMHPPYYAGLLRLVDSSNNSRYDRIQVHSMSAHYDLVIEKMQLARGNRQLVIIFSQP